MSQMGQRLNPHQQHEERLRRLEHLMGRVHEHMRAAGGGGQGQGDRGLRRITEGQDSDANDEYEDLYWYIASFGSIVAAATQTQIITIQADSKFEWMKSVCSGNLTAENPPFQTTDVVPVTLFITDSGSGRQLMNVPVPLPMICGTGQLPFILPVTRIFMPKSTITLTAQGMTAATYDNVYFGMVGRKIFKGINGGG